MICHLDSVIDFFMVQQVVEGSPLRDKYTIASKQPESLWRMEILGLWTVQRIIIIKLVRTSLS